MKSREYENCKVNEIAGFFGISTEILRYYDRQGILEAKRNKDSNYRRYDWPDFVHMYYIRMLREMGVKLEEVESLMNTDSLSELWDVLNGKYEELELEIDRQKRAQYLVGDYLQTLNKCRKLRGGWEETLSPWFILRVIDAPISKITEEFGYLDSRQMPRLTLRHEDTIKKMGKEIYNLNEWDFTVSITDATGKLAESALIRDNPHFVVLKPENCLHVIRPFGAAEKQSDSRDAFRFLFGDSSLSEKYRITGNALSVFISIAAGDTQGEVSEIWLPVERK